MLLLLLLLVVLAVYFLASIAITAFSSCGGMATCESRKSPTNPANTPLKQCIGVVRGFFEKKERKKEIVSHTGIGLVDECDGCAGFAKPSSTTNCVDVLLHCGHHVKVDHLGFRPALTQK